MSDQTQAGDLKPFACELCPKKYSTKAYRRVHMIQVHQNAGRFKCSYCSKNFQRGSALEIHERAVHTGEKPFRCKICQRPYTSRQGLYAHHLNHHAEKIFRCQLCEKRFGNFSLFRSHLQCHSGGRFQCNLCERNYQHKRHLRRHERLHHSDIQQETSVCLARDKDRQWRVIQSESRNDPSSAPYSLRTRDKTPNYRAILDESSEESRSVIDSEGGEGDDFHFQDSDEELSEPDETANGNDVLGEQVQNSPTEIGLDVSAELSDEDEEPNDQKASGNVLEEQNNETETDRDLSTALSDDRVQDTNLIILSSDEEDDGPDSELVAETSTVGNVTLKLVYNVEYRAPY